jgi:K+-transporting ATPase ATPase B chain
MFSIANDAAKYFAIIPAMFAGTFLPVLSALNIMHLKTPESAVLSAVIFNALIIIALDLAGAGGSEVPSDGAAALLPQQSLIYGAGGTRFHSSVSALIDLVITRAGLA